MLWYSWSYWSYMLPGILLVLLAQWWVSSTYRRWSRVGNRSGVTGAEAAYRLLSYAGLSHIAIEGTPGTLTDHYDPRRSVLRLSPGVAQGQTVAALAIAAHEIGHAMQDAQGYVPLRFRAALVPAVNVGSWLGWLLILLGLFIQSTQIAMLGVVAFSLGVVFALATLPVELNASARAMRLLSQTGLLQSEQERRGARSVLSAAAFTYVAALATAVLQLLYYLTLVSGIGGRRRA